MQPEFKKESISLLEKYAGKKRKRGYERQEAKNFKHVKTSFSEQHGLCFWCHDPMEQPEFGFRGNAVSNSPMRATCEHIIRRVDGGKHGYWNIVAAHRICNSSRHGPTPEWKRK
jgi:5-methylcytosine-specific restriction endonuclease McrA